MASSTTTTPTSTTTTPTSTTTSTTTSDTSTSTTTTSTSTTTSDTTTSTTTTPTSTSTTTTDTSTTTSDTSTTTSDTTSTTATPTSTTSTTPEDTATSTTTTPRDTDTVQPSPTRTSRTPAATTTFQSTVFVQTTNSQGSTFSTAPAVVTSIFTSTGNSGNVTTVTQIGANPTLNANDDKNPRGSAFFRNTGAVAGVFVLVGLAAASIFLWIIFALRRRRRTRRMEHDTAVSATLAAAGFHRAPLDDDDDDPPDSSFRRSGMGSDLEMRHRRSSSALAIGTASSAPSHGGARSSAVMNDTPPNGEQEFNPYGEQYVVPPGGPGYVPARTSSPPPTNPFMTPYRDQEPSASGSAGELGQRISHSASHSAGSYEPLLASYYQQQQQPSTSTPEDPPAPPRRNPQRAVDGQASSNGHQPTRDDASSVYSSESTDGRLDPGLKQRLQGTRQEDLRDSEDYSRPVLGVRNLPDARSQISRES